MRIFTLAENEAVAVGEDIVIRILDVSEDGVRLAIESVEGAPVGRDDLVVELSQSVGEPGASR